MGIKAAFRYFDGEDIPTGSLTPQAFTVFCVIRPYIDEAQQDYEKMVTYSELFAYSLVIIGICGLFIQAYKKK